MTALLPRLDREQTRDLIEAARGESVAAIAGRMPTREVRTTSSPLGGLALSDRHLDELRTAVVGLASEHGYPDTANELPMFDARCARVVHGRLRISPHEASEEDAWSHLTCCWLLDVAAWRWGGVGESDRRFRGDVNRNTFRRLWWRAEILGPDVDLADLGEDELVNIMERPTIAANRRLARALATAFIAKVRGRADPGRMMLMREAGKRLVRLTPLLDFFSLDDVELQRIVEGVLQAAADGGNVPAAEPRGLEIAPSEGVERVPRVATVGAPSEDGRTDAIDPRELEEYNQVALGIAGRTGRVTNSTLREVVPLEPADARRILQDLVERGQLVRSGRAKGTYYVLPTEVEGTPSGAEPSLVHEPAIAPPTTERRSPTESALRRFLRRRV